MHPFWRNKDEPKLSEKAQKIIERRTGYPESLLKKVEEKIEE